MQDLSLDDNVQKFIILEMAKFTIFFIYVSNFVRFFDRSIQDRLSSVSSNTDPTFINNIV